jgi:manganese efflux pump family protein
MMTRSVDTARAMLRLIVFVLPLGLDTFAVSAALGASGAQKRERLRISLLLSVFEMAMPVVGLLLGRGLGSALGNVADYIAIVVLAAVGAWTLVSDDEGETEQVSELSSRRGLALLALGVSISLDELAMGFTIGLIGLSLWLAVILIGLQAFAMAQIGLRLGGRLSERYRKAAAKLAGLALIGRAILLLVEKSA